MGVRFLIGRAGVGKSWLCAQQMRGEMARDPLGGPLWWIVPEQGTFTAERMLLTGGKNDAGRGSFRAKVVSFRRLAVLIGREAGWLTEGSGVGRGRDGGKVLDDVARAVLLEEVVRERRDELVAFRSVAGRKGFIEKLDAVVRELRQAGHTGASLRELIESGRPERLGGELGVRKLRDLAVVLEGWSEKIERADAWDFEKVLHRAALEVERDGAVPGVAGADDEPAAKSQVWVDGFTAMSYLEMRLLVALAKRAAQATVTVLADADLASEKPPAKNKTPHPEQGVFARTERMYRRLREEFRRHALPVEGVAAMRDQWRFHGAGLREVEAIFDVHPTTRHPPRKPERTRTADTEDTLFAEFPDPPQEPPSATPSGVEIWQCSDPETEVRVAAQAVREMVVQGQRRYREVGLIVPRLEGRGAGAGYGDAVRRVFGEHGIPYFVDERRSVGHHPLVELVRAAVGVRVRGTGEDVLLLLKSGLAGVSEEAVAETENYVLAHGLEHGDWSTRWQWGIDDDAALELVERVNAVRQRVWQLLGETQPANRKTPTPASPDPTDGAAMVRWAWSVVENIGAAARIAQWAAAARARGEVETAMLHEQAWKGVAEVLGPAGGLEQLLLGRDITWTRFEEVLATALERLTLGLIPATVDQVVVTTVQRGWGGGIPEMKVVLLLGAVEGAFPRVLEDDPLLSDAQRELLEGNRAPEENNAGAAEVIFDYLALTRASEKLVISYPVADRSGKAVGRSRYVGQIERALQQNGITAARKTFDAASRTALQRIATIEDVLAATVAWVRRAIDTAGAAPVDANDPMAAVYDWVVGLHDGPIAAARNAVWASVRDRGEIVLARGLAERFYPPADEMRMSVSQLEKFAACPLQYFMHYTLGLKPREVLALDAVNMGTLYHRILERFYGRVVAGELPWPECDERDLRGALEQEVAAAAREVHGELQDKVAGYEKQRERTKRTLGIVLEADRRRACQGSMRPVGVEVVFGKARGETGTATKGRLVRLPVLRVEIPGGRSVAVTGKIDRVDAAEKSGAAGAADVCVMDYKSSSRREVELGRVYWGLDLQLPVYGVVMRELAGKRPRAALYVPLGIRRKSVKSAQEAAPEGTDAFYQDFQKPRGIVDETAAGLLDRSILPSEDAGGKSDWFNIGYRKDGGIPANSDMLLHDEFELVLNYARWKVGSLAGELAAGKIGPAPYRAKGRAPCDECDFSSLCPFDRVTGTYREMPRMARSEALHAMAAALGTA